MGRYIHRSMNSHSATTSYPGTPFSFFNFYTTNVTIVYIMYYYNENLLSL